MPLPHLTRCQVRARAEEAFLLRNSGLCAGRFSLEAVPPFSVTPCDGRLCAGGPAAHCVGPLRSAAAANSLTIVTTTAHGDCAFDSMAFWDGAARNLACWKRLRIEIASLIREHALEATWVHAQQPLAASAVAGGNPTALPSKRRLDVCIRLKQALGCLVCKVVQGG